MPTIGRKVSPCTGNKHSAHNRTCTRERHQCNGHSHENGTRDASFIGLLIHLVHNPRGQGDFKSTEEARCKYDENQGKE